MDASITRRGVIAAAAGGVAIATVARADVRRRRADQKHRVPCRSRCELMVKH
jgi:hypothetical protein